MLIKELCTKYYNSNLFLELLELPPVPKQHHFRFKIKVDEKTHFLRIRDRIYSRNQLVDWINKLEPWRFT